MVRWGIAIALLCSLFAGCGSLVYQKWGASEQQRKQDELECEYDSRKATVAMNGIIAGMRREELKQKCMQVRGYQYNLVKN